jgi:mannose-6-phosphate isomerase class I
MRGDMHLIAVVMGSPTRDIRNEEAKKLLDYGFSNYAIYSDTENDVIEIAAKGGMQDTCRVKSSDFFALVEKGTEKRVRKEINLPDYIAAPVKKGETYFIPAGMLHAIGAGILIAEIQQNSDLTYRVYDFDRVGADGKTRELHVDKALAVTRPYSESEIAAKRFERGAETTEGELLANSKYFKARRLSIDGIVKLCATRDSFVSLLCIDGEGTIVADGKKYPICKGDSFFVPAGMGDFVLDGDLTVIISEV